MSGKLGIYEFNLLSETDKYDTVFTRGQFVVTVKKGPLKYALYSLSYFWVEVQYDELNNKIAGICSFVAGEKLNRYSNVPNKI